MELKYPEDFVNKILNGDCLEVMKDIPDNSIDCIFTDPPYGIDKKKIKGDADFSLFQKSLIECYRILKDKSFYLTFIGAGQFDKIFIDNPFTYRWTAILYINNGMVRGNLGFSLYQPCMIFQKGDAKIKHRIADVMEISTSSKQCMKRFHPYEKYLPFVRKLIHATSNEEDIILDPFCGGGNISIGTKQMNRKYMGIEISKERLKRTKVLPLTKTLSEW